MLNRRHLRVKVLQALYAFHQFEVKDLKVHEKALLVNVDKVYEMYIWLLALIIDVTEYAEIDAQERVNKHLPSADDLNPNVKILQNSLIINLKKNEEYLNAVKKYKVSWDFDPELSRALFSGLKNTEEYLAYLKKEETLSADRDIIKFIFRKIIIKSTLAQQAFEEKHINWPVDQDVLQAMIAKTLKNFVDQKGELKLASLSLNWVEDREFMIDLFQKCAANDAYFQKLIGDKTKNWEAERIAMMDTLIMKMALSEFIYFSSIPIKVSINEYLEIAKEYSTPKSNSFINGILDKILDDLKRENKIRKYGRGLIE